MDYFRSHSKRKNRYVLQEFPYEIPNVHVPDQKQTSYSSSATAKSDKSVQTTGSYYKRSQIRCALLSLVLCLLVVVIVFVVLYFVYFKKEEPITRDTTTKAPTTTTTTGPFKMIQFIGDISLLDGWDPDLADKTSPKYLQLVGSVSAMIDAVFMASELRDVYLNNTITGFRNGSTIAEVILSFKDDTVVGLSRVKVNDAFKGTVDGGRVEETKAFKINTAIISFRLLGATTVSTTTKSTPTATTTKTIDTTTTEMTTSTSTQAPTTETSSTTVTSTTIPTTTISTTVASTTSPPETTTSTITTTVSTTTTPARCGGHFTAMAGTFSSPNYPEYYPKNVDCRYVIMVPENYRVILTVDDLDTELSYDLLQIYDGMMISERKLAVFSGDESNTHPVLSSGNSLLVQFKSDDTVRGRGFNASYTAESIVGDVDCDFEPSNICRYLPGYNFKQMKGEDSLVPPSFDNTYGNSSGHYLFFTSGSRETGNWTTNNLKTTSGGCLYFHYYIVGGVSVEIKIYLVGRDRTNFVFYSIGYENETDQWLQEYFTVPAGEFAILFETYGDIYFSSSSVVAIDDILFLEGTNCPSFHGCNASEHMCRTSGVCIPNYLTIDGYSDCLDGSDENKTSASNTAEPSVRLIGGMSSSNYSSGRLEIQLMSDVFYTPVCLSNWDGDDTMVLCRELGYRSSRLLKNNEYGRGRPQRSTLSYDFNCTGHEKRLSDCHGNITDPCDGDIAAIECLITDVTTTTEAPAVECDGNFSARSGTFTSPYYPGNYPANADCEYTIEVQNGDRILLQIVDFFTQTCCDFLEVYDGKSSNDSNIFTISGHKYSPVSPIVSSGNSLFIKFTSDNDNQFKGYKATYKTASPVRNIGCDFEDPDACWYLLRDFVRRKGFVHHLPAIDHTFANESGHYMFFTTMLPDTGTLTTPYFNTSVGGCISFYYNMEGWAIAELKAHLTDGINSTMAFYANGMNVKTDQWIQAYFPVTKGMFAVIFDTYGEEYYMKPTVVAIDDISFHEGVSCPFKPRCTPSEHRCELSGVCIPQYLTVDGHDDCPDGSDERITMKGQSQNSTVVAVCSFEPGDNDTCPFSNDISGMDDTDWIMFSKGTDSEYTGPNGAIIGSHFIYIETSSGEMEVGESAVYKSSVLNTGSALCMSFFYHMYGRSISTLEVSYSTSMVRQQVLFSVSSDQGNKWYRKKVYIPESDNLTIMFNATDGVGYQGDIAIDHIMIFENECDDNSVLQSRSRLVVGEDVSSGRLEIQVNLDDVYKPVCLDYWDEEDAEVVCREHGYNNSRLLKLSEYGIGKPGRAHLLYQYFCMGNETKLSECYGEMISSSSSSCPGHTVGMQCSNTECFGGAISCGDTSYRGNVTCIRPELWCDGYVDCPNKADEVSCAKCSEFECNNHKCIPKVNKCDGIAHCNDSSDEFRCVIRNDTNSHIVINRGGKWNELCYTDDVGLAKHLCDITGHGLYVSSSSGDNITPGVTAVASVNSDGIIKNYQLQDTGLCTSLEIECVEDIECGVPSVSPILSESYILFGNDAINGEWPWAALLLRGSFSICGASIIDRNWAITAAHCVDADASYSIHVGEVEEPKMGYSGQNLPVAEVFYHENWKGSSNSYSNDIAVLRLATPAIYNNKVRPVCVATEIKESYSHCFITGWGYTHYNLNGNGVAAQNMKETEVDVNVNIERCNQSMITLTDGYVYVPENGICVENKNPHSPACSGDSGGPVVCLDQHGRWEILGVTSFGVGNCFTDQIPDIYQSIPHNMDWIKEKTGLFTNITTKYTTTVSTSTALFSNETTTTSPERTIPPIVGVCGGNFTTVSGSFATVNYPAFYPDNSDCHYIISLPVNYRITLNLLGYNTESNYDFVRVYDGWSTSHPQIKYLTGFLSDSIGPVISTTNSLLVWFTSDGVITAKGFYATYTGKLTEEFDLNCDFEDSNGCGYGFGIHFVWREGFIHHLPSIDHTFRNVSGHYLYFTSNSRKRGIMASPYFNTSYGGCFTFYYNIEGGPSAELKIYLQAEHTDTLVFYTDGMNVDTDQWVKGEFNVPPGQMEIIFETFGDIFYLKPAIVALDDVFFDEGKSCIGSKSCNEDQFKCHASDVCVPEYITLNGYNDCLDGSDESYNETKPSINGTLISYCSFEPSQDSLCLFYNDISGDDAADWSIGYGSTPSVGTGPSKAAVGSFYLFVETSVGSMDFGDTAVYKSSIINQESAMCMSFYYHMYGNTIGSLEVRAVSPIEERQILFMMSSDQGEQWYYTEVNVPQLQNLQIVFKATDGNGFQGDISIDNIAIFQGNCSNSIPSPSVPKVRLVGGRDPPSGRLEIQVNPDLIFHPVCTSNWDEDDTKVVCRELGYRNSRFLKLSEYGRGRLDSTKLLYSFDCNGDEEMLSECGYESTNPCGGDTVAVQCSNSQCFAEEFSCGDTNSTTGATCIPLDNRCDGNVECPNAADEIMCGKCNQSEFECHSHQCIPHSNKCDGIPQCDDNSDEFRCVIINSNNNHVQIYKDNKMKDLCYSDDITLAKYLCSITGYGSFTSFSSGNTISNGLTATTADNPNGIIAHYVLNHTMSCNAFFLECGDIECGIPSVLPKSAEAYILSGIDAVNGEYPWNGLLFMGTTPRCGATLIDSYWAVTAAHCVDSGTGFSVHFGEVKRSEMESNGQEVSVTGVFLHDNYEGRSNSYLNDIALLRLFPKAGFNENVRPACVGTDIYKTYTYCFITGWGYTHFEYGAGVPSDNMKEVRVDMNVDVDRCNASMLAATDDEFHVPANGICVDNQNPYSPACNGDSGGPLVCRNNEGRWELVGVGSFGVSGCLTDQVPMIYQSVPHNVDWIEQMTGLDLIRTNPTRRPA